MYQVLSFSLFYLSSSCCFFTILNLALRERFFCFFFCFVFIVTFIFLVFSFSFFYLSSSCFFFTIRNLALRERFFCSISCFVGKITFLLINFNGALWISLGKIGKFLGGSSTVEYSLNSCFTIRSS